AAAEPTGAFLNNVTPTLTHDPSEDVAEGETIIGNLHPVDPDSQKLRYTETVFIGLQRTVVASDLHQPTDFQFLPDGRVVIAEKTGAIKIVENGTVLD